MSCDPTAISGTPLTPGSSPTGPMTSPGWRSGGKRPRGIPAASITSTAHVLDDTSSSAVVEALVTSAPTAPVSQYASRSGISSRVDAADSKGVPSDAASW